MQGVPPTKSAWPTEAAGRVLFLLDAASALDERILRDWVDANRPGANPALGPFQLALLARRSGK